MNIKQKLTDWGVLVRVEQPRTLTMIEEAFAHYCSICKHGFAKKSAKKAHNYYKHRQQ